MEELKRFNKVLEEIRKEIKVKKSQGVFPLISVDIHLNECQFFVVPQSSAQPVDKYFLCLCPSQKYQEIYQKQKEIKTTLSQVLDDVLKEFSKQNFVNNKKQEENENKASHYDSSSSPDNETLKNSTTKEG